MLGTGVGIMDNVVLDGPPVDRFFADLANPHRRRYLAQLRQAPLPASRLAASSSLSVQEAMRHLARLERCGLVRRGPGREYHLTPLGTLVQARLPYYGLLFEDPEFANRHDLAAVPPHLSLAPLLAARRVRQEPEAHLAAMAAHVAGGRRLTFLGEAPLLEQLLHRAGDRAIGAEPCHLVLGVAAKDATRSLRGRLPATAAIHVVDPAALPLQVADTEAGTMAFLRNDQGPVDPHVMLRSEDPAFAAWAEALYAHFASTRVAAAPPQGNGERFLGQAHP